MFKRLTVLFSLATLVVHAQQLSAIDSADEYYEKIQSSYHVDMDGYYTAAKGLMAYAEQKNDSVAYARGTHALGIYFQENGQPDSALIYQSNANRLFHKQGNLTFEAQSLNNIGVIYKGRAEFTKAIEYFIKAMEIADKEKVVRAQVYARTNTGESYFNMGNVKAAVPFFEEALKIALNNNEELLAADASLYLGNCYVTQGNLDGALKAYNETYEIKKKLNQVTNISPIQSNIGVVYFYKGDLNKAIEHYQIALYYSKKYPLPGDEVVAKMNIGEAYGALNKFDKAHVYTDSAILLAKKIGNKNYVSTGYAYKKDFYQKQNNLPEALKALELSHAYKDSVINESNNRHLAELQEKYQADKRTQEISSLNQQNTIQQLTLSRQKFYFGGGIVILLLGGLSAFQFQRTRRYREKMMMEQKLKEEQDRAAHAIIESELNERRRIAAELHDGVVQTFSAAKMNLSGINSSMQFTNAAHEKVYSNTMALIDEGCTELRSISHSMMPEALLKKGLPDALREMVNRIDQSTITINLGVYHFNYRLHPLLETSIYRIIQECISNTLKHAGATTLDIQLTLENNIVDLTIEDNGKGFDMWDGSEASGIGLKNIRSRTDLLGGSFEIDSRKGEGTLIAITIPLGKLS